MPRTVEEITRFISLPLMNIRTSTKAIKLHKDTNTTEMPIYDNAVFMYNQSVTQLTDLKKELAEADPNKEHEIWKQLDEWKELG